MASDKFEYMLRYGPHEMDRDVSDTMFKATDAEPGSQEKIEILRKRCSLGQPLFHENDRVDYHGFGLLLLADALADEYEED